MPHLNIATFNLMNLAAPGTMVRGEWQDPTVVSRKVGWIAGQLIAMRADLVGFQEVFDRETLLRATRMAGFPDEGVVVPGADGDSPMVGLASKLPILSCTSIADFPEDGRLDIEGVPLGISKFSRPILHAVVQFPGGYPVNLIVVHLKSQRPLVPDGVRHDPTQRVLGKARSLLIRTAEAAALRAFLVGLLSGNEDPLVLLGDLNDGVYALTSQLVAGDPPHKRLNPEVKHAAWDVLLHSAHRTQARRSDRDVLYTHIHNGRHEILDHILVSDEFESANPRGLGHVEYVRVFNDHIGDATMPDQDPDPSTSDHGQVVATLRLKD